MIKSVDEILIDELTKLKNKYQAKVNKLKVGQESKDISVNYNGVSYCSEEEIRTAYGYGAITSRREDILIDCLNRKLDNRTNKEDIELMNSVTCYLNEMIEACEKNRNKKRKEIVYDQAGTD